MTDSSLSAFDYETSYWLSRPNIGDSIAQADADIATGRVWGEEDIRAEFGLPPRRR